MVGMTGRAIAVLACRVLAIYTVLQEINLLYAATVQIGSVFQGPGAGAGRLLGALSTLAVIVLLAGLAVVLWVGAGRIARVMVPGDDAPDAGAGPAAEEIQAIGFSIVGLLVLIRAIPHAAGVFFNYWFLERGALANQSISGHTKVQLGIAAIELVLGACLLSGARGLTGVLKTVRQAGLRGPDGGAD
jgi:hypothetical protein